MASGRSKRSQAERRLISEAEILRAAAAVVASEGVGGTTLAAIAARAGVSKALTLHHFGSKNSLVSRLVEQAQSRLRSTLAGGMDGTRSDGSQATGLELVRRAAQEYLQVFERPAADDRALLALWGAMIPEQVSVEGVLEADRRSVAGWAGWIRLGQQDGSIRKDLDAEATGATLMALTRGCAALMMIDPSLISAQSLRASCDHWVSVALAPQRPAEAPRSRVSRRR